MTHRRAVRFEPLQPASRGRLIGGFVLGPVLWLLAIGVGAWLFDSSWAIALGLMVSVTSFLVALLVLALLRAGRLREERRYANRG